MKHLILSALILLPVLLYAQNKRGDRWILGYCSCIPGAENDSTYGGMYLTFNAGKASLTQFDIFSNEGLAVANDPDGNLEFYSTGCGVFNKEMALMENGEGINPGGSCLSDKDAMIAVRGGNLVLPQPAHEKTYYYFHVLLSVPQPGRGIFDKLFLTKVDMTANNGLGKVISKNEIVLNDSLICDLTAVKHGNGRDWWIVIPRGTNRQFWTILLTPEGMQQPVLQTLPPPYTPFTAKHRVAIADPPYYQDVFYNEYQLEASPGQADFSPDGNWYARITPRGGDVEIYRFNRCKGTFDLRSVFPVPQPPVYPDRIIAAVGLAFSPDSKLLYFNNIDGLYQLPLTTESLAKPKPTLIAVYDYFQEIFLYVNFFQMRTAPDGKIYMNAGNSTSYLHVIENPNMEGKACNFKQRGIHLPRYSSFSINYFPNFNLFEAPYGLCDTLGINTAGPELPFEVFPNPGTGTELQFYIPNCTRAKVLLFNAAGQLLREINDIQTGKTNVTNTAQWPAGVYFVTAFLDEAAPITKRVVIMR